MSQDSPKQEGPPPNAMFVTTCWTMVLTAGDGHSPAAHDALSRLCSLYWYPLYAYVRRQGQSHEEAQDLTQEFFARLLARESLRSVDQNRGRFRSFLMASMNHFLANEWRDARRLKRGGGQPMISLDAQDAESRYKFEPVENASAERIYERRWALTLLDGSLRRLREEIHASGKAALFETLRHFLTGERADMTYAEAGLAHSMSEEAVNKAVQRLRKRYRDILREDVANTVSNPEEVDEELRYLMRTVAG